MDLNGTFGTDLHTMIHNNSCSVNYHIPNNQSYKNFTASRLGIFDIVNICSVVSCTVSTLASAAVIVYLFLNENRTTRRKFHCWSTGERLVIYLAVFDCLFSVFHLSDFTYMLVNSTHPPLAVCRFIAFILIQTVFGQWFVVLYTSTSAFLLVLFQKKIKLGVRDWRLLLFVLVPPAVFNGVGLIFDYIGPGPLWCGINSNQPPGKIARIVMMVLTFVVFGCSLICYLTIYFKMRSSGPRTASNQDEQHARQQRYFKSANVMMLFVLVYLLQWWPWVLMVIRSLFGFPEFWIFICKSILVNMGGVLNAFAYTWMRKYYLKSTKRRFSVGISSFTGLSTKTTSSHLNKLFPGTIRKH